MNLEQRAASLVQAREHGSGVLSASLGIDSREAAFALQEATVALMGPLGGWKVGAKGPHDTPSCAPLPARGIVASGARFTGAAWPMRGVEVEVAVRLARDLPGTHAPSREEIAAAVGEVLPVIEVVQTRLADWRDSHPLAQMADLQTHGALVLGAPCRVAPQDIDLRGVDAFLAFDGQPVASTHGANPAGDVWRLLAWLAVHCESRGLRLSAGQVVTTGSCTGMLFAPEGAQVQAALDGFGRVELRF